MHIARLLSEDFDPQVAADPHRFTIVLGGPLYQLLRRAHVSGDALELARRRVVAIALVAWLPLLALALASGQAFSGPAIPFVGIVAQAFDADVDDVLGKPIGAIFGKYAVGTAPEGSTSWNVALYARAIRMVLGWRLGGRAWPNPFFDRTTRAPSHPLATLSAAERETLRPLCGPRPISPVRA